MSSLNRQVLYRCTASNTVWVMVSRTSPWTNRLLDLQLSHFHAVMVTAADSVEYVTSIGWPSRRSMSRQEIGMSPGNVDVRIRRGSKLIARQL